MDVKKNLNNTQRKMLDEIYSKTVDTKISEYQTSRNKELSALKRAELDKVAKQKDVKAFIDAITKAKELYFKAEAHLKATGGLFELSTSFSERTEPTHVKEVSRWGYNPDAPKWETDHQAETSAHVAKLQQLKDEVRLRVYGSDATYASIEAEINALLKGVI